MATLCPLYKSNYTIVVITIFFFHLMYCSVTATTNNNNNGGFSAHLIRRNSPNSPLYRHKNNKNFRRLMGADMSGYPLRTDPGNGHNMKFSMGTPPSDIYAIADTGSTLLWTQCKPCKTCYKTNYAMFDPRKSSTYRNINCSERECRLVDDNKPASQSASFCRKYPTRRCTYNMTYADTASSEGVLAKETITLTSRAGQVVILEDIVIGCGHLNTANANGATGNEMGIIGLGPGPLSFVSQIAPHVGGNKFSYCLVPIHTDPKFESKINFGNGSEVLGEGVVSTPLVGESSYVVEVEGITIGNEFVPFNSTKKVLKNLHMIIDTGSTVGHLPRDIWDRVITQLNKTLGPELETSIVEDHEKEKATYFCLNSMTIPKELKVTFHFKGGGKLQLMEEQIFIKEEKQKKLYFGLAHLDPVSGVDVGIFGAVLQGNLMVGYDLNKNVASFKPTNCLN